MPRNGYRFTYVRKFSIHFVHFNTDNFGGNFFQYPIKRPTLFFKKYLVFTFVFACYQVNVYLQKYAKTL